MSSFLQVKGIHKSFTLGRKRLDILRNVSFEVDKGEMVAITGQSGTGKTTLLHILGTIDRPDEGDVCIEDSSTFLMNSAEIERFRNAEIGFVFQFFQLLPEFTALENVMMPLLIAGESRKGAQDEARQVLDEVGLSERVHHFPSQLSGGEQQRAALARALVREPRLLLADEPTGNLDVETGRRVFSLLRTLQQNRGLTSIIVTHNLEIAQQCDRVLQLETLNAG